MTPPDRHGIAPVMRVLLAILALIGLLLSPAVATAAAATCNHAHEGAAMVMSMGAPQAEADSQHDCCDPDGKPVHHDGKSCAQACAAMCVVSVTLPAPLETDPAIEGRAVLEATPQLAPSPHPPPNLKRPPKHHA